MHGINGQVGGWVVRWAPEGCPSMGLEYGRGCAREGDGEHYNPWGFVDVESHRILPPVIVPNDVVGDGR